MLLCLTKGHSATEVHFYQADPPQEVPGMNYKISQVPTELYHLQDGIFQELSNSLLLTHNLLFGLRLGNKFFILLLTKHCHCISSYLSETGPWQN